jgi:hypothetical protein
MNSFVPLLPSLCRLRKQHAGVADSRGVVVRFDSQGVLVGRSFFVALAVRFHARSVVLADTTCVDAVAVRLFCLYEIPIYETRQPRILRKRL